MVVVIMAAAVDVVVGGVGAVPVVALRAVVAGLLVEDVEGAIDNNFVNVFLIIINHDRIRLFFI